MRTFHVAFEGWFNLNAAGIDEDVPSVVLRLSTIFEPLEAVGAELGFRVIQVEHDADEDAPCADYEGWIEVEADDEELAFDYAFALMNAFLSPHCGSGLLGDWEVGEVEEAGASKVPA